MPDREEEFKRKIDVLKAKGEELRRQLIIEEQKLLYQQLLGMGLSEEEARRMKERITSCAEKTKLGERMACFRECLKTHLSK